MLEIRNIDKDYEGQPLLRQLAFKVGPHETVCLLGPSGSGKSTLLRLIAGLEIPDRGQILWDGHDLESTPAHLRDFGLVFQDYALFPHLNVLDNVAFGLRMRGRPEGEIAARVGEVLEIVDLAGFGQRSVTELSGGEQQRVALARALAPQPRLLMFDEPLGALDRVLREDLLAQLRLILHQTRIPAIYVTHDQEEAFAIADRVLLLHDGLIVRSGPPAEVWSEPRTAWVAEFLGLGNVIRASVESHGTRVKTPFGSLPVRCSHRHRDGDQVNVLLRLGNSPKDGRVRAKVLDVTFHQDGYHIEFEGGLHFDLPHLAKVGTRVTVPVEALCLGAVPGPHD